MRRMRRIGLVLMLRAKGLANQMTLGARCVVLDEGQVLLVRHSYAPGWQFPGGGVDPGETAEAAARRELIEETGVSVPGPVRLIGIYHNITLTNRDHVALYLAHGAIRDPAFRCAGEIAEIGWFDPDRLPDAVNGSVRRRLAEIAGKSAIASVW
ncbi:NUDIX domain-containing protein [Pelagibacterium montanilacus]|uniref:NUDIX domain-containing protein n=1 Tax=Pelagibacterium montanilacus TaxID=2185280 RepID=UPI001FE55C93|nr:NUDIX domain-containing protein [Pelagibacterium montanilacus]